MPARRRSHWKTKQNATKSVTTPQTPTLTHVTDEDASAIVTTEEHTDSTSSCQSSVSQVAADTQKRLLKRGTHIEKLQAIRNRTVPGDIKEQAIDVLRRIFPDDDAFGFPTVEWIKDCGHQALSHYRTLIVCANNVGKLDIVWNKEPRIMYNIINKPFPPHKAGAKRPAVLNEAIVLLALERCEKEFHRLGLTWPLRNHRLEGKGATPTTLDDTDAESTTNSDHVDDDDPSATQVDPRRGDSPSSTIACVFPDVESTSAARLSPVSLKRPRDDREHVNSADTNSERLHVEKKLKLPPPEPTELHVTSDTVVDLSHQDQSNDKSTSSTEDIERAASSLGSKRFLDDTVITRILWAAADQYPENLIYVFDPSHAHRQINDTDKINVCEHTTHAILPICEDNHWTAAIWSVRDTNISVFDSLVNHDKNYELIDGHIRKAATFFVTQLKRIQDPQKSPRVNVDRIPDEKEWSIIRNTQQRQKNGWDCGVFVLVNCLSRIHGKPLSGDICGKMWRAVLKTWLQGFAEPWVPQELPETYLQDLESIQPSDPDFTCTFNELTNECKSAKALLESAEELAELLRTTATSPGSGVLQGELKAKAANIANVESQAANPGASFAGVDEGTRKAIVRTCNDRLVFLRRDYTRMEQYERRCREARANIECAVAFIEQQTQVIKKQKDDLFNTQHMLADRGSNWFQAQKLVS